MNFLIHIGYHKTGTSLLQQRLFHVDSREFNPVIPKIHQNLEYTGGLIKSFGKEILDEGLRARKFDIAHLLNKLKTKYVLSNDKINVISNEALSGAAKLSFVGWENNAKIIQALFPNAVILIGIREQKSWIESMYYQYLRMGGALNPKDYFEKSATNYFSHSFVWQHLCYDTLISKYIELFGATQVIVYAYEDLRNGDFEFVRSISEKFKIKDLELENDLHKVVNKKLSLSALEISRLLSPILYKVQANGYSPIGILRNETQRKKFLNSLNRFTPISFENNLTHRLQKSLPLEYLDRYKNSNKILSKLLGINLADLGYPI